MAGGQLGGAVGTGELQSGLQMPDGDHALLIVHSIKNRNFDETTAGGIRVSSNSFNAVDFDLKAVDIFHWLFDPRFHNVFTGNGNIWFVFFTSGMRLLRVNTGREVMT